ncbi:glycosyltransferase family 2 protein [bacterium]|nr:glycosyltransferase family 2 protein [candidate division CSSED10-310 bacterium]
MITIDVSVHTDISVIIPCAKAPEVFRECLEALSTSKYQPREIILVDDAMDETSRHIASEFPVNVVKNPSTGVASARNHGANIAEGSVLLFIDTDVIITSDALKYVHEALKDKELGGIVGVQSVFIRYRNFFSVYKNHWMRYTYKRLKKNIHLFYTSFAAIRKEHFTVSGGFDENYRLPSVEDTAFGAVLGERNIRIDPLFMAEFEHAKAYSLKSILKTDFNRSIALVRYVLRTWRSHQTISKTSVPKRFMVSSALMGLIGLSLLAVPLFPVVSSAFIGINLLVILMVNGSWIHYLAKNESVCFSVKAAIFLPLDILFVVAGMFTGFLTYCSGKRY